MLERLAGREILGLTLGLDVAGDLDPRAALLRLQDEWAQLISQLGARGPAVLVIEDLHWAAEPLVEVLERVLSHAEGPRPGARHHAARAAGIPGRRTC